MDMKKRTFGTLAFLAFHVLAASVMNAILPEKVAFNMLVVSTCYLLALSIRLYLYLDWTMVKSPTKTSLLVCAAFFTFLFLIRGTRYLALAEPTHLMRYLWYAYYIALLLIPYFSLRAAVAIGCSEDGDVPKWPAAIGAGSVLLLLLVLTNDFHQLAFKLNEGFRVQWVDEYRYGFLYYIVFAWITLVLILSLAIMLQKCRVTSLKKYIWSPLIPSVLGLIWLLLIPLGMAPTYHGHLLMEFPDAFFFTVAGAWLCCVRLGLTPANQSYAELFRISSVRAKITDQAGNTAFIGNYAELPDGANASPSDTLVRSESIPGGFVFWQTDIGELNRMNEELDSIRQQLEEENELIRLENELKEKNAILEARSQVYDTIAVRILDQSRKITELSAEIETEPTLQSKHLRRICFYGSFIKRMSNLMLLAEQKEEIPEMEIDLAMAESLRRLSLMDIKAAIYPEETKKTHPAEQLILAYEAFESYIDQTLPVLKGVYVRVKDGICRITLECDAQTPLELREGTQAEWDEETCFVKIPIMKGGDVAWRS